MKTPLKLILYHTQYTILLKFPSTLRLIRLPENNIYNYNHNHNSNDNNKKDNNNYNENRILIVIKVIK